MTLSRSLLCALCVVTLSAAHALPAAAQEHPDSGVTHHDMSHDGAATAPRLGHLVFPTSASPAAHTAFIRGMLYLHNFHYPQAAAAFREAQKLDSGDVMSYWGEAVSYTHPVWNQQDTAAGRAVLRRLAPTATARLAKARTPHERAWLATAEALYDDDVSKVRRDTLFSQSLDHLRASYPRDIEAQLFYALSLLGLNEGDRDVPTYLRAYAIARRVFRTHPNHPGAAHYVIHAVDDPTHAKLGLDAARAYSRIAPDAGHAQHMTSHIFIALGMWDDVIAANMRAIRAAAPRRPHYGHGTQWLVYALIQEGRYGEAASWLDSIRAQSERLHSGATKGNEADLDSGHHLAVVRAAYLAETGAWSAPIAAVDIDSSMLGVQATAANELALGLATLHTGARARANSILERMADRNARARPSEGVATESDIGYAKVIEQVLRASLLHASGKGTEAVDMLARAATLDDSLPFAFGPPVEIISPHELAGEYLLELGRPADALEEYKLALGRAPGRTAALLGLAMSEAELGQRTEARRSYTLAAKNLAHADAAATATLSKVRERLDAVASASAMH